MTLHSFCQTAAPGATATSSPHSNNNSNNSTPLYPHQTEHNHTVASITTDPSILLLKTTFRTIIVVISAVGVLGNVLNLLTLRSPSLRTVPFLYIRALALFDLVSMSAILLHFFLEAAQVDWVPVVYYEIWVEDVVINSFLVAGLYVAGGWGELGD